MAQPYLIGCTYKGIVALLWLALAVLCSFELLPPPAVGEWKNVMDSSIQQSAFLFLTFCSIVAIAVIKAHHAPKWEAITTTLSLTTMLGILNLTPLIAWIVTTYLILQFGDCNQTHLAKFDGQCDSLKVLLDAIGIISGRLARIDLGITLLLSANGTWLLGITNGYSGLPESLPMHRTTGWWCVVQSFLHSVAYFLYYSVEGGSSNVWQRCFPTPMDDDEDGKINFNRLGLVNCFGVIAFVLIIMIALFGLPAIRKSWYYLFQRTHLHFSMLFVLLSALHDLPILVFVAPGLTEWLLSQYSGCHKSSLRSFRQCLAKADVLEGTSGPWTELRIIFGAKWSAHHNAPLGEWASVRVIPLGNEFHPLSVSVADNETEMCAIISSNSGDWSQALARLAQSATGSFSVEVKGPYPIGGGNWSLRNDDKATLLVVAGGTGISGWLSKLHSCSEIKIWRECHLVWCVRHKSDYVALLDRLPLRNIFVSIYVTRYTIEDDLESDGIKNGKMHSAIANSCAMPRSRRSQALLSLVVVASGLVAYQFVWRYGLANILVKSSTILSYAILYRFMPILVIIGSMAFVFLVSSYALRVSHCEVVSRGESEDASSNANYSPFEVINRGELCENANSNASYCPLNESRDNLDVDHMAAGCTVRYGRPDLEDLIGVIASKTISDVIVTASGTDELVKATRMAASTVSKGLSVPTIRFVGVESKW